jgi:hypothetical protein
MLKSAPKFCDGYERSPVKKVLLSSLLLVLATALLAWLITGGGALRNRFAKRQTPRADSGSPPVIERNGPVPVVPSSGPRTKVNLSTPRLAVESFVAALNSKDYESATQCITAKTPLSQQELALVGSAAIPQFKLSQIEETINNNTALLKASISTEDRTGHPTPPQVLTLSRIAGSWRIAPKTLGTATVDPIKRGYVRAWL